MDDPVNAAITWLKHMKFMGVEAVPLSDRINDFLMDLELLRQEVEACRKCPLALTRKNAVFGQGPCDPRLMIVGEAPGKNEDEEGRPFCGPSGDLLDRMLGAIGLKREDAFITSVVKCRPPRNRRPLEGEIRACKAFLDGQIRAIRPGVILCLGEVAAKAIIKKRAALKDLRAKVHRAGGIKVVATYHPAYILRFTGSTRERAIKKEAWEDLQLLKDILEDE